MRSEILASDGELLERWRRGEAGAMDRLVDRHAGSVYAFAMRFLGDAALAEDVTQEVWLRVLRRGAGFDGRSSFTTWLFAITRNACIDHRRRATRRREAGAEPATAPEVLEGVAHPGPPVIERVARRELSALVERAVAALPDEQREVFLLRERTALSFREIAEALELPRDTVKSRMRYALGHVRRFIRRALQGEEVETRGL